MIKAIFIIVILLVVPAAEGKMIESTTPAGYVQALETANAFLWAWSNRNADSGTKLLSYNLLSKIKKENDED
jgi:hypothetical protein